MMSRAALIFFIAFGVTAVHATDCTLGTSKNWMDKLVHTCPGILDSSDKSYCCIDLNNDRVYCCNAEEFALSTGLPIIVPAIIAVVVVISVIVFCISCLCCTCCPWYKRRHPGTIYGKVQTPAVVTVVQTGPTRAYPQPQTAYAAAPLVQAASPAPAQPPPYTQEPYTKQSPYNPSYQQ